MSDNDFFNVESDNDGYGFELSGTLPVHFLKILLVMSVDYFHLGKSMEYFHLVKSFEYFHLV